MRFNLPFALSVLFLAAALQASAQENESSPLEFFGKEAQAYKMQIGDKQTSPLELATKPVLHWTNPAGNGEDGAVYVWLQHGRPEVIGTIFTLRASDGGTILKHSLHSLSSLPITADYSKRRVWSPKTPGVSFQLVPDAPPPAESSRARLSQMKALAKDFSGKMVDLRDKSTELRLLPQPLVRYEPTAGEVVDGAIFALAEGTDPQALVLIEARRAGEGARPGNLPSPASTSSTSGATTRTRKSGTSKPMPPKPGLPSATPASRQNLHLAAEKMSRYSDTDGQCAWCVSQFCDVPETRALK